MASSSEKKTVEADEFVLKDKLGRVRAKMAVGEEGPVLSLYDANGETRVAVGVTTAGPCLSLYDTAGKPQAGTVGIGGRTTLQSLRCRRQATSKMGTCG